jgi:hypothetical protein
VRRLLAPVDDEREPEDRGLPPVAISRAERLIAEAMDRPDAASPTLRELAATARLSTNHFIRSFRRIRGWLRRCLFAAVGEGMTNAVYAVTGASGHLGRFAVQELLARGVPSSNIVAIARTPGKVTDLAQAA